MRYTQQVLQNHPPGCLTYNRNPVLCADTPVPGQTLTSLAGYCIWYGLPQTQGFLLTPYMKQWYEFYSSEIAQQKLPRLVGEIQSTDNQFITKIHQLGGEISESPVATSTGAEYPSSRKRTREKQRVR